MSTATAVPLIICFGDSLTSGYQSPIPQYPSIRETPYGTFLQEALDGKATVSVSGLCGELTSEMTLRFRRDVLAHEPSFVIILGGTNDLGWDTGPSDIMRNLVKMYESAKRARIEPVAVTIPSLRPTGDLGEGEGEGELWIRDHILRRQSLNRMIEEYCISQQMSWVDLFKATCEPGSLLLASRFSNDGLHLTTEGYRALATLLYNEVFATQFGLPRHSTSRAL